MICQEAHVGTDQLTCPARESGGYQCEVIGPHERHAIGDHTIRHALMGNGYTCRSIPEAEGS